MELFERFESQLKAAPKTIVFTEGTDARILSAASRLLAGGILKVILLGNPDDVQAAAAAGGFDVAGAEVIDPANYEGFDADTVRPALQLIKCKPGVKSVSSSFILVRGEETLAMGDCAINIDPSEDEIVEITVQTAKTAEIFGIDPRVALLSYSSKGSGKGETVDKMRNATARVQADYPELKVDGELQFDAAVAPEVGQLKAPGSPVAGYANTFIFPNINAGNIGYKIAQRLGGFEAYGPILQGLNAPINDLSRGCNAEEVYKMALITAALI